MYLKEMLCNSVFTIIKGSLEIPISDICYDSGKAEKDMVFVCIQGVAADGHHYIEEAVERGAAAVIVEYLPLQLTDLSIPVVVQVNDSRKVLAQMSAVYFSNPDQKLCLIGITGTKGKTTVSHMLKAILEKEGKKTGLIGTNGNRIGAEELKTTHTTPPSYEIYKLLRLMADRGCLYVIMEVSSQGLKLSRVFGLHFAIGIFTNISLDHIGTREHKDFEEYLYWKKQLFLQSAMGIVNQDDAHVQEIRACCTIPFFTFGMNADADLYCKESELIKKEDQLGTFCGMKGMAEFSCRISLPGRFNIYNGLAAAQAALLLGCGIDSITQALETVSVKGRTQLVYWDGRYHLMIDYAHNAASMESLLKTLREYEPERIVCVFGCGGNRSAYRRYAMGRISGMYADLTVVTEDNSREEPLAEIIHSIVEGVKETSGKYFVIPQRKHAIYYVMKYALEGDFIILAGKGHEDYIERNGKRYPFCEEKIVEEISKQLKKEREGSKQNGNKGKEETC